MNIFSKGTFHRDVAALSDLVLLVALREKIEELEKAPDITRVTGLKLLRGYETHYRIKVITSNASYRIGAVIRGNTIWLVRFISRKKIYQRFP
jgi:mRNA-degrading endonuclease RelE of RelBE toxin-antitoxin system